MRLRWCSRLGLALLPIAGCGGDAAAPIAAALRDSAGIAIVENPLDSASLRVWQIPDSPVVDIGGEEAGPGALQQVRAAIWGADGTILVGDGASREIRRFDTAGRHLETWGRDGDGPGEFRSVPRIWPVSPDSVGVHDFMLRRITVLSRGGVPGTTMSLRTLPHAYTVQPLAGNRVLLGFLPIDTSRATSGPTRRSTLTITVSGLDSLRPDTILVLPAFETYPVLGREGDATFPAQATPIFGKGTVVRADGSRVLVATNDAYEIAEYDQHGGLQRLIRVRVPARPVTDADHAAYVAQELQAIDEFNPEAPEAFREQWRAALREQRVAAQFPFIDDLLGTEEGGVWAEAYRWRRDEPRRYVIFDREGRLTARAEMPARARPLAIRGDRILALWRDADDIEHVRIYPVRR